MSTPWGMINAKREASQAREKEKNMHAILVKLIDAVEGALKDLQDVEASRHVREKLQEAIKNAQDEMRGESLL